MASFLLIHGSWHGAWCWDRLVPLLQERGHRVVTADLPGHGEDHTSLFRVTLGSYAQRVVRSAELCAEPPIVVGHSMGGMAISQAATDAPDAFAALVYLCAFVPQAGESMYALALCDERSLVREHARLRPSGIRLDPEHARTAFYGDCGAEDIDTALARLRPDPWLPAIQRYTARRETSLPRGYIECTADRAVTIERQRFMAKRAAMDRTSTLESDHSPFLSQPDTLADHLHAMSDLAEARSPR